MYALEPITKMPLSAFGFFFFFKYLLKYFFRNVLTAPDIQQLIFCEYMQYTVVTGAQKDA